MIKYTNKLDMPWYIAEWLLTDTYDSIPNTISATRLLCPARALVLLEQAEESGDVIEIDISELFAARYGTTIHESMESVLSAYSVKQIAKEQLNISGTVNFTEKRFFAEIDGYKISGKPDAVLDGILHDFKSTSAYKYKSGDIQDYQIQLSIYRWLLEKNGIYVPHTGKIDFIFTDWSRTRAKYESGYPASRYTGKLVELYSSKEVEAYIRIQLARLERAKQELPLCTPEELWQDGTVYAHMREGRKKAVRLYDTYEEAAAAVANDKENKARVEERVGKAKRCAYCDARSICEQYKYLSEQDLVQE